MLRTSLLISSAFLLAMSTACASPAANQPAPLVVSTTRAATTVAQPSTTPAPSSAQTTPTPTATAATTTSKPKTTPKKHSRAACLKDENQCYEPGTNIKCQTGGCVNAARGLTQSSVGSGRQKWLREHPGWCPVGTQGAVAPC
jgi:hypothetical protein